MAKHYNKTVNEVFSEGRLGWKKYIGSFGIEIEVEGNNLPVFVSDNYHSAFWTDEEDRSLRGESREYVLKKPVSKEEVSEAITELKTIFKKHGAKVNDSMTTSVHVHMNCQKMTMKEVACLMTTYYCLEHLLMEYCGEEREGNKFCLRASDAEELIDYIVSIYRRGRYNDLGTDRYRYAGMNFTALPKYGSLEFRGMRGVLEWKEIEQWIDILDNIKSFALKQDKPSDIIFLLSHNSALGFLKMVLPNHWGMFYGMTNFERRVLDGVRLAQDLAFCEQWEKDPAVANVTRDKEDKPIVKKKIIREAVPEAPRPLEDVGLEPVQQQLQGGIGNPNLAWGNGLPGANWARPADPEQQNNDLARRAQEIWQRMRLGVVDENGN